MRKTDFLKRNIWLRLKCLWRDHFPVSAGETWLQLKYHFLHKIWTIFFFFFFFWRIESIWSCQGWQIRHTPKVLWLLYLEAAQNQWPLLFSCFSGGCIRAQDRHHRSTTVCSVGKWGEDRFNKPVSQNESPYGNGPSCCLSAFLLLHLLLRL